MRIDSVTIPDIRGKTVQQALELLKMSNELEDLKGQVQTLERR